MFDIAMTSRIATTRIVDFVAGITGTIGVARYAARLQFLSNRLRIIYISLRFYHSVCLSVSVCLSLCIFISLLPHRLSVCVDV